MPNDSRSRVLEHLLDELERVLPMRRSLVGIDGFDGAGKTHLAHELAAIAARQSRRPVLNVSLDDFHHPRGIRHRHGRGPESFYRDSYDHAAFVSRVVVPLRAGRPITPAVWDVDRDQPVHPTTRRVPEDGIVLVDGMFLHRPELVDVWDASVWVEVPFDVSVPRGNARLPGVHDPDPEAAENHRYVGGQRLYLAEAAPATRATWVLDNTDLAHPRLGVRASRQPH